MKDKHLTPYTEAVLHEISRRGNILPMAVWHSTKGQPLIIKGHYIPPRTSIIPMIGTVMHDPNNFADPMKFDPDRYLKSRHD
jgi:cytochrome P450 family 2 subfamily K